MTTAQHVTSSASSSASTSTGTCSPSGSRRFGDTGGRPSSACASCRSPKRARASPSPRLGAGSSQHLGGSSASMPYPRGGVGRSGSSGNKKYAARQQEREAPYGNHAATSPCRSPNQGSGRWGVIRTQRRREMSVPLLSKSLSHVSLSQSSPPREKAVSQDDLAHDLTRVPSSSMPPGSITAEAILIQTPKRISSLRRIKTPAPLDTSGIQQFPCTEPMPVIHSLLGSPFNTTRPQLYPYELASPTVLTKGGYSVPEEGAAEQNGTDRVPEWSPEWRENKDVLPELLGAGAGSPSMLQARNNSCASDDGSWTSSSSFFSSTRQASSSARPTYVSIWGDEGKFGDDHHDLSTPNRKLFSQSQTAHTRPHSSSSNPPSPLTSQTLLASPPSSFEHFTTAPLTRIVTASPTTDRNGGALLSRSPIPGYLPRMTSSARKADERSDMLPFENMLELDAKTIMSQRRISEPLQHSSADAFAAFLARCGGDQATRSDASAHGHGHGPVSPPAAFPSSEGDDFELSPLRTVSNRVATQTASVKRDKVPTFAPSPSSSLQSIKTRLDKLKNSPRNGNGGGPSRSQSTRVTASARAVRPDLRRGVTEPRAVPQIGTPVSQLFGDDKPSPAAFASTGLVKKKGGRFSLPRFQDFGKGRTWSPLPSAQKTAAKSALAKSVTTNMDSDSTEVLSLSTRLPELEDTDEDEVSPIRPMRTAQFRRSASGHSFGLHRRVPSAASDTTGTSPLRRTHARVSSTASSIGGLRRKGSSMFNSGASINSDNISEKGSPATPTKGLPFSAIQGKFGISTPSPTVTAQQYPFARRGSVASAMSIETTSPTVSPFRGAPAGNARVRQLGRMPIARTSNPMLAATFKTHATAIPTTPTAETVMAETFMTESARAAGAGRFERDFTLVQALGSGEFSCVWKVRSKADGGLWAVKTGRPYTGARNRLRQLEEVTILRQLSVQQHPHIVDFADSWEQSGRLYIRTELADCGDLARYLLSLGDSGGLDEGRVWKVLVELSSALDFIHRNGILHLDFKPSNILVMRDGKLKVADFGMSMLCNREQLGDTPGAKLSRNGRPLDRDIEGDREYLCPELLRDAAPGPAADMFSLGIMTLEAALNVVLPSNGDAWVKLRNDDFSDIEEHSIIRGQQHNHNGTDMFEFISEAPIPTVSIPLINTIKHMMAADPSVRMTQEQLGLLAPLKRARTAMYEESLAGPALVEEEEGWVAYLLEE